MFRFTIRDVLWLTALVALVVTWRLDRAEGLKREDALRSTISEVEDWLDSRGMKRSWERRAKPLSAKEMERYMPRTLLHYPPDPNSL